jgi:hypothetical protein
MTDFFNWRINDAKVTNFFFEKIMEQFSAYPLVFLINLSFISVSMTGCQIYRSGGGRLGSENADSLQP